VIMQRRTRVESSTPFGHFEYSYMFARILMPMTARGSKHPLLTVGDRRERLEP